MTQPLPERGQLLIIDDEEEILKALYRQFRREYDVYTAPSAEQGYRLMTENPIQVIISDQRMPGMNGAEFFGKIKNEYPDAIRLLLTGYADIQAVISAINDGNIFRYIAKPWDPVELDTIVREAFERYHLIVQNRKLLEELQESNTRLEQRVAERTAELEEMNGRLLTLNQQKDSFLGMAAHDLRTPLTVLQGFTDLLTHPSARPEDFKEFIVIIRETIQQMLVLLDDLLDITAIEAGKLTLRPETVAIAPFIERICKLSYRIGEQKGIQLVTDVAPDLPPITFDPRRIEQVLNNLLSNAFKFSHGGTTVTVQVRTRPDAVEFAVIDQGQGIRANEIDMVFGEFQRVSTKPTGDEGSTGLGLSICRRIVDLHNGHIAVESESGQGSRFYFTLPLT
ncbi:hybrid sensor histidine kinase/response regulator [Candidatus Flexifilum breve]|uniref:hybrid sensor histidine kinase/response regulator n=1 Tax=Candidatus Flexifilum breve TaxID=3140694 RepID=UPI0031CC936C